MAGNIVNRSINIFVESGEAEAAYNRLLDKEKKLKTELDKATDPKQIQKLKTELDKLSEPLDRASKKASGQLQPSIRELEATFQKLRNQVRNFDGDQKGLDNLVLKLQKANVELQEARKRTANLGTSLKNESLLSKAGSGASEFFSGLGGGLLFGGAAAAGAATLEFFSQSIDEANQAERAASELKNTLDNLGKVESFGRLTDQAQKLADKLGFIDNDDLIKVQQKLLTYGKLTEKQINDLLPVITDFAVKTGQDLPSATEQVISGLEGQGKALKQFGINIKEGGTVTERFGIIMTDLKSKVDGAAEAFSQTKEGSVAVELQKFKNLQEEIGGEVGPIWAKIKVSVLEGVSGIIQGLQSGYGKIKGLYDRIFNPEVYAQDQARATEQALQDNIKAKADSFVANLAGASLDELRKELTRQGALLKADADQLRNNRTKENLNRALESKAIFDALNTEINLRKEKNKLADADPAAEKKAAEEAKKRQEQAAADFKKLMDELAAKALELQFYGAPQLTKDLNRVNAYYDALEERARGNAKVLRQIEDLRNRENFLLVDAYQKAEEEKRKKLTEEQAKKQKALDDKRLKEQLDFADKLAQELAKRAQAELGDKQAGLELNAIQKRGKARLDAELKILDFKKQQELSNADLTQNEIGLIEKKYQDERAKTIREFYIDQANKYIGYANAGIQGLTTIFDALSQRENQELERDRQINDKKKSNLEARLKKGLISQQQYNSEVAKLDAQQEKKEREIRLKQFKRDKALKIANTIMNTAQAVVSALSVAPPAGFILAAIAGAIGAVQLGIIASQKAPEFAKGGYLPGPSHKDGGMPVINPRTGQKVAEVEGGEVILSKATVRNNRNLVAQLLDASMNRGGSRISPSWASEPYQGLNVNSIHRSQQRVRMFETGGVLPGASDAPDINGVLDKLDNSINALVNRLSGGIPAYTVLSDQEAAQSRKANILKDATIK